MKAVKETQRIYYKLVDWIQPTLESNGALGVDELACYAYSSYNSTHANGYQAFLPNTGRISAYKSLSTCTVYMIFHSKNYLLLSNFSFRVPIVNTNNDADGGYAKKLTLEGFNQQTMAWETLAFIQGGSGMGNKTHTMDLTGNTKFYKYFRFQASCGGGGHADQIDISQIQITAKQAVECEEAEHEFYEDKIKTYLPKKFTKRNYYKYGFQNFVQPVLSADGLLGRYSFAVYCANAESSYQIYKAFDGSASTFTSINIAQPSEIIIYNPNPLVITNFQITNRNNTTTAITGYTIYGSNDNADWVEILSGTNEITTKGAVWDIDVSENSTAYKYYKIAVTSANTQDNNYQVAEIAITAQEQIIVEGTEQDHDFYRDEYTYYGITG